MKIAAVVLLVLAAVLIGVSVALFVSAKRKRDSWQRMLGTGGRSVAELRALAGSVGSDLAAAAGSPGSFAEFVTVTGTAEPGPAGVQRSPVSGTDCVWHRVQVERRVRQRVRRDDTTQTETRTEIVSDVRSQLAFGVADGTGLLPVEPNKAAEHDLELIREDVRGSTGTDWGTVSVEIGGFDLTAGGRDDVTETTREWVIRPGSRLTVAGTLTDDRGGLTVRSTRDVPLTLSRLGREELIQGHQGSQRTRAITAAVFDGVGLVCLVVGILLLLR